MGGPNRPFRARNGVEGTGTVEGRHPEEGEDHGGPQDRDPRGVARGTGGAAQAREGAHTARRRDRAATAGSAVGARGEGLPLRHGRGREVARGSVRRAFSAARVPLHVRTELRGRLPVNSSIADSIDGVLPHLHARDATLLLVSQAPLEKLQAYKRRMGWRLPWVSSSLGDFNFDLGFSQTEEQSREAVEQITRPRRGARGRLGSSPTRTGTRSRRSSSRTPARRVPTSSATSPRAPDSARSSGTAMRSTTRTRRRGVDWSSS